MVVLRELGWFLGVLFKVIKFYLLSQVLNNSVDVLLSPFLNIAFINLGFLKIILKIKIKMNQEEQNILKTL
jgi:hypothetical protein